MVQRGIDGDSDIAEIGALLADRSRCRVLLALGDGRALPASVLAAEAGVAPSTASEHLSRLSTAGLLSVETHGRYRYYRLAGPAVGELLERLSALAPARPVRSLREGNRAAQVRAARTCYDHIAGRLGVGLMETLLERGYLAVGDDTSGGCPAGRARDGLAGYGSEVRYRVTGSGWEFLDRFGARVGPGRRPVVRYCVDWSEQRHHLSGGLGRAVLDRLLSLNWIRRHESCRAVLVTPDGRAGLREVFGIDWN